MATQIDETNLITDDYAWPIYNDPEELIQELRDYTWATFWNPTMTAPTRTNNIYISMMKEGQSNKNNTMVGSKKLQT